MFSRAEFLSGFLLVAPNEKGPPTASLACSVGYVDETGGAGRLIIWEDLWR